MGNVDHIGQHPASSVHEPQRATARATILVIDDEPLMRTVMKRVLEDEGYVVLTAADPQEALALAARIDRPDLVMTDYMMPGMDGLELSGRLRERWPAVPIVLMSGASQTCEVRRLTDGHGAVLEKPFEIDALIECVGANVARALTH